MCIAIPLGQRDGNSGTRLGRWLRERPARIARLAALPLILGGALSLALAPAHAWTSGLLLVGQGLALPLMGAWLEGIPRRCQGSEIAYLRHGLIALLMLAGAAAIAAGGLGFALGALLCALAWRLAARPLGWQLRWCRGQAPARLPWIPRLMSAVAVLLLVLAATSLTGAAPLIQGEVGLLAPLVALMGVLYLVSRRELA